MAKELGLSAEGAERSETCVQTYYAHASDIPNSVKANPACVRPLTTTTVTPSPGTPESVSCSQAESSTSKSSAQSESQSPSPGPAPKYRDKYEELLAQAREIMKDPEFMEEVTALARLKAELAREASKLVSAHPELILVLKKLLLR